MTLGLSPSQLRHTVFSYEVRALRVGKVLVSLTPDQADILWILYRKFGEIVSNDDLISGLYGQREPKNAQYMVRRHIWDLRKILNLTGSKWEIVTEHRKGMRLRDVPRPPGYGRGGRVSPSLM